MLSKLKEIYKEKLIEEVKQIDKEHYYFYQPSTKELFGIEKTITKQEYELLKMQYIEKNIYTYDNTLNQIYTYVLENGKYPFSKKMKLIIYKVNLEDETIVSELLAKIYHPCFHISIFGYTICFYYEQFETKLSELFETITSDLGYSIPVHEGIMIDEEVLGKDVFMYIESYCKQNGLSHHTYSDVADLILEMDKEYATTLIQFLKKQIYLPTFKEKNKDILDVMIKTDLNVSSSAKYLYMNRNSLINRLEVIYKETGFNLQKFKHACAIYILSKE